MRIVSMNCPNCGATLQVDADNKHLTCSYCGNALFIDDEVNHVKIDSPERVGYEFEKGRQRAQAEQYTQQNMYRQPIAVAQPKKRRTWLWVLGWLFIFPLPLTILTVRSQKIKKELKIGIIAAAWLIYFIFVIAYSNSDNKGDKSNTSKTEQIDAVNYDSENVRSMPSEGQGDSVSRVTVPKPIEIETITINTETSELALGETKTLSVTIEPDNAEDKTIKWESSDETVLTVDEKGKIIAVGGGSATITAKAKNGIAASQEWSVDSSKRTMSLRISYDRVDNNNIGDEWSYDVQINGEYPGLEYTVAVGKSLKCLTKITESDEKPDVGQASKTHIVTESDMENGFTVEMDVYVTENGGRNSGKSAHFVVTYKFSVD